MQGKILEVMEKRFSPYAFSGQSVEKEKLLLCFEAARWHCSSFNEQPWAFILAYQDQPVEFAAILDCLQIGNQGWAKEAPFLMITCYRTTFSHNNAINRVAMYDLGAAMAAFTLQARALDLFVHQMSGMSPEKARKNLHIPEGWEACTAVAVGYLGDIKSLPEELAERQSAPRRRKEISNFVFMGEYGKQFVD